MTKLIVNDKEYRVNVKAGVPLVWVIREELKLTGTKFGCGLGLCGACTVLIDGVAQRSCVTPVEKVEGKRITTIEGLPDNHPVKTAWIREQVPQCGYCQPGQILQAVALLAQKPDPSDQEIGEYLNGNVCRCGTYPRIKAAIKAAAKEGRR